MDVSEWASTKRSNKKVQQHITKDPNVVGVVGTSEVFVDGFVTDKKKWEESGKGETGWGSIRVTGESRSDLGAI